MLISLVESKPRLIALILYLDTLLILVGAFSVLSPAHYLAADTSSFPNREGTLWAPYLEWSLNNPTYTGNPYDVIATATFVHAASGEKRTTGMFYDGGNTWKFRFSGTQTGQWSFTTSSSDPDLSGHSGSVNISSNPGSPGFVTHFGNKWGRTGTNQAFVPQFVMIGGPQRYYNDAGRVNAEIQTFFVGHGFNGFHTPVYCRWFDLNQPQCSKLGSNNPNPDRRTFESLELMITKAYEAGGLVHIWLWGDDSRYENPKLLSGGLNGPVDRRLQRYIAARLGPLPGWTMGYGYDVYEWADANQNGRFEELDGWHAYLQAQLGWKHYLGARSNKNKLDQLSPVMDYSSYEQHKPDYATYVNTINVCPAKPSFSEDRFRIRQPAEIKDYTMEQTRRGLWHSTMAGGVANIWGNLVGASGANDGTIPSAPYPNPEQIKTYAEFFKLRFSKELVRCNNLSNGMCLKRPDNSYFIFYKENSSSLQFSLLGMAGTRPLIAVDTRQPYAEIALGAYAAGTHVWQAPYTSDWAIAAGNLSSLSAPAYDVLSWDVVEGNMIVFVPLVLKPAPNTSGC